MSTKRVITIGFYGADTPAAFPNLGNQKVMALGNELGATMFRSLSTGSAFRYLQKRAQELAEEQGARKSPIVRIFGHSWGGLSAVQLAWKLKSSTQILEGGVDLLAVIDPVSTLRLPPTSVPANVRRFWNRYQTHGRGVTILKQPVYGRRLPGEAAAVVLDQMDLNPGPIDNEIDHWTIIDEVRSEFISLFGENGSSK